MYVYIYILKRTNANKQIEKITKHLNDHILKKKEQLIQEWARKNIKKNNI